MTLYLEFLFAHVNNYFALSGCFSSLPMGSHSDTYPLPVPGAGSLTRLCRAFGFQKTPCLGQIAGAERVYRWRRCSRWTQDRNETVGNVRRQ
jgi:hypothetical protein